MTASEVFHVLNQVPPRHELVVMQGETTHRVQSLSYSHEPAQVTLRLEPVAAPKLGDKPTDADLRQLFGDASPPVAAVPAFTDGFARWWGEEGMDMAPRPDETHAEHVRRLCEIAWSNGHYRAREPSALPDAGTAWPVFLREPEATIAELNSYWKDITKSLPLFADFPVKVWRKGETGLMAIQSTPIQSFTDLPDDALFWHSLREVSTTVGAIMEAVPPVPVITEVAPLPEMSAGETFGEAYVVPAAPAKRTRKPKNAPFGTA